MTKNVFEEFTLPSRRQLMILKEKSELTVQEVARLFHYNDETVRRKIYKGIIPAVKRKSRYYIPSEEMYKVVSTLMLALSEMTIKAHDMPQIYNRRFYNAKIQHPLKDWINVVVTFDVKTEYVDDYTTEFYVHVIFVNGNRPNASGNNCKATIQVQYDEKNLIKRMFISTKWKGENDFDYHPTPYGMSSKWRMVIYWIINHFILKFHRDEMRLFVPLEEEKDG